MTQNLCMVILNMNLAFIFDLCPWLGYNPSYRPDFAYREMTRRVVTFFAITQAVVGIFEFFQRILKAEMIPQT